MHPIAFAIENPVKVAVAVILFMLFGLLSLLRIPIQLTPDVDKPVITVSTFWAGASPQEVESEIVDRQEEKLKNVSNLEKMTSVSQRGSATITLEFPVGVDKDIAYRDVSDKLRQVTGYPEQVDEPTMSATDDDMAGTIAWMILYDKGGQDVSELKTYVEDNVKPILERAEGIAEVPVFGGLEREIQVVVDAPRLAARELTFQDVEQALRRQNRNISAGTVIQGKRDFTYRTIGEYTSLQEVRDTVIADQPGGPVLIGDVAQVVDGFKKQVSFVRSLGRDVLALPARKETGANVIQAMENLKKQIKRANEEILEPRGLGLELTQVYDETTYIWGAIDLVANNIVFGGLLAVVVLLVFLRSLSATGIVAVAIPIAGVSTFLIIALLQRSLNVVMLAGMAFAVGMVVDNSIVVLENIFRHRAMGKSRAQAALDGGREVWGAVLASTLTTMAVFLPIITIQEEAGQLFKDIAIAISASVFLSLLVAVAVIPPLASKFLGGKTAERGADGEEKPWRFAQWTSRQVDRLNRGFLRRSAVVLGISLAAILGSWWLAPAADYLPAGNRNLVFGFIISPPGYSIDEFREMAFIVEEGDPADPNDGLRPFWEAERGSEEARALPPVIMQVGQELEGERTVKPPPIENFFFVSFDGGAFMGCTSKVETSVKPLENVMNRAGGRIPGVFTFFNQSSLFGRGAGGGTSIDVEIRSDDKQAVAEAAGALQSAVSGAGYERPRADPTHYALGSPEIQVIPERTRLADVGMDLQDLGFVTEAAIEGAFVGEYNDRGNKIDLVVQVIGTENATVGDIGQIPIYTPTGDVVPLSGVARLVRTASPQQINHIEEMSAVTLAVKPKTGVPLEQTMRELSEEIIAPLRAEGKIADNVITALAGTADKLTQTRRSLMGDFRGLITAPRIAGFSVPVTMTIFGLIAAILAAIAGIVGSRRNGLIAAGVLALVLALGFFALNTDFLFELIQSRMILALLITYLLMAALFESFAYPFVIMFSVPLATVGGFAALRVVHEISLFDVTTPIQQLDVVTMLGFVILIGIVVNNAILLVHQALNYMRNESLAPRQAIAKSVATRTRPIFMSAMTSVFGMAPLVIMPGAGSELYRGIGSVVLGGLLVSTVFTLIVVPVLFSLFLDARAWVLASISAPDSETVAESPLSPTTARTGHAAGLGKLRR